MSESSEQKSRSRLRWIAAFFIALGGIGVLLAEFAAFIPPSQAVFLAPFGLFYPISASMLMVGIAGALVFRRWKWGAVGIVLLWISGSHFLGTFGGWSGANGSNEEQSLKILTWNVRQFNRYAWIESPGVRDSILTYLKEEKADVICLQECFLEERKIPWMSKERLMKATGMNHWAEEFKLGRGHDKLFGLTVLSRYPILSVDTIRFDNDKNNSAMHIDVAFDDDTLRIFNLHLSSIGFEESDYDAVKHIELESSRARLMERLSVAWIKREQQANRVVDRVESSPFRCIVAGDFNDTPVSYTSGVMSHVLRDAYAQVWNHDGPFLGATYAGDIPFLRIDQVWMDSSLKIKSYKTGNVAWSDHRPVTVEFYAAKRDR
ncbi:MAG: endonuclease/exonuclease/phosphatase family protein [Bacteroidetes bacterium]|nr:endonuclease/exonuclease/phosphatase family protein [Bacteroidota bacterium]MDA1335819.1 endonuclease/exonuclease/phosphatase family protein [Bacteroidota bacterium]